MDELVHTAPLLSGLLQLVEATARMAIQYRSLLKEVGSWPAQLASSLSRVSDVLRMMAEMTRRSMSSSVQAIALKAGKACEESVRSAEDILIRTDPRSKRCALIAHLSVLVGGVVDQQEIRTVIEELRSLKGRFFFVLQVHQAQMTERLLLESRPLLSRTQNGSTA